MISLSGEAYAFRQTEGITVVQHWTGGLHERHYLTVSHNGEPGRGHPLTAAAAHRRFTAMTGLWTANRTSIDRTTAIAQLATITGRAYDTCATAGCNTQVLTGTPWCTTCGQPIRREH